MFSACTVCFEVFGKAVSSLIKITLVVIVYFPSVDTVRVQFLRGSASLRGFKARTLWIFHFTVFGMGAQHAEMHRRRSECLLIAQTLEPTHPHAFLSYDQQHVSERGQ